jgi:hypothetical protein
VLFVFPTGAKGARSTRRHGDYLRWPRASARVAVCGLRAFGADSREHWSLWRCLEQGRASHAGNRYPSRAGRPSTTTASDVASRSAADGRCWSRGRCVGDTRLDRAVEDNSVRALAARSRNACVGRGCVDRSRHHRRFRAGPPRIAPRSDDGAAARVDFLLSTFYFLLTA